MAALSVLGVFRHAWTRHAAGCEAESLRKISGDPLIEAVESRDVAQLFIDNPKPSVHKSASWDNMFATHPPIEKRIELLEQFA